MNIDEQIQSLEKKINEYKSQRSERTSYDKQIEVLEKDIDSYESKISSVRDLSQIQEQIDSEISKFGDLAKDTDLPQRVESIKKSRIEALVNLLLNLQKKAADVFEPYSDYGIKSSALDYFLPILIFLQIVITFIVYLINANTLVILAGFLFSFLNLVVYFIFRTQKGLEHFNSIPQQVESLEFDNLFVYNLNNPRDDALLVNAAWISALKKEKERIDSIITSRLNHREVDDIKNELHTLRIQLDELKNKKTTASNQMSAEEYLKLRRELDILKIEKENHVVTSA